MATDITNIVTVIDLIGIRTNDATGSRIIGDYGCAIPTTGHQCGGRSISYNATSISIEANEDEEDISRIGYHFAGWARTKNALTADYDGTAGKEYSITGENAAKTFFGDEPEDVTLYAFWAANAYTVVYDANEGDVTGNATGYTKDTDAATYTRDETVKFDEKFTLLGGEYVSRTGYEFAGWYTDTNYITENRRAPVCFTANNGKV